MKKCYKYFGCLLNRQEKWLNEMAEQGCRLVKVGKLLYGFEECSPHSFIYRVEFIGNKSKENAEDYRKFLEDLGYKVFYKNINLSYSVGKLRYRPWAEKGGKLASDLSVYNKELLIIEKANDGTPFRLHTSFDDLIEYYRNIQKPWLYFLIIFGVLGIVMSSGVFGIFSGASIIPCIIYQRIIGKLKKEAVTKEW